MDAHIIVQSTSIETDEYANEVAEEFTKHGRYAIACEYNKKYKNTKGKKLTAGLIIEIEKYDAVTRVINSGTGFISNIPTRFKVSFDTIPDMVLKASKKNEYILVDQWALGNCRNCVVYTDTPREPDEHGNIFVVQP